MGRGRAKAKQTKVARQLKYSSGGTDLDRLQEELAAAQTGSSTVTGQRQPSDDEDDDDLDPYERSYAGSDDDEDD